MGKAKVINWRRSLVLLVLVGFGLRVAGLTNIKPSGDLGRDWRMVGEMVEGKR